MILLIDNYDSFSYNLYQLVGKVAGDSHEIRVIRNDELSIDEIEALSPATIILSPGPGRPADAGVCEEAVLKFRGKIPILGVCLGHQAICEAYGGVITYAEKLMHGKQDQLKKTPNSILFRGIADVFPAARYHSLVAEGDSLPEELSVTALSPDGEIMAVEDAENKVFGVQFHPESVLTPGGETMIWNFLKVL